MISLRELDRRYKQLMNDVATDDYYKVDLDNRVNCYRCNCGHITKTIDVDAGCTPFLFSCEKCGKLAKSTFYNDIATEQEPTIKWYRPSLAQARKMRRKESEMLEHVLSGGLHYCPFKK